MRWQAEVEVDALSALMPMLMWLDGDGRILSLGPTLARVIGRAETLFSAFAVQVPVGAVAVADLLAVPRLRLRAMDGTVLRGLAVPDGAGGGAGQPFLRDRCGRGGAPL